MAWRPIIAANWRCNLETIDDIEQALNAWKLQPFDSKQVDVVVCSSLIHAAFWRERVDALGLQVSAQVCSSSDSAATWETASGGSVAFTAQRLRSLGVHWTVLGHSDWRRRGETDQDIAMKLERAQEAGLKVILCIGGLLQEPESGDNFSMVATQLDACIPRITAWQDIVVAYEPPKSTGATFAVGLELAHRPLSPTEVETMHVKIRDYLEEAVGLEVSEQVRIQYAGSVFPGNCVEYLEMPNIDGFLVNDVRFKYTFMKIVSAVEGVERRRAEFLVNQRKSAVTVSITESDVEDRSKETNESAKPLAAPVVCVIPAGDEAADTSDPAKLLAAPFKKVALSERRTSRIPAPTHCSIGISHYREFLVPHRINPEFRMYDMRLYESGTFDVKAENVRHYFNFCKEADDLVVTTSCFNVWRKAKKKNYQAKVIPALPRSCNKPGEKVCRVFFFDDNVNLHLSGASDAAGICNLRDVVSGEYVDFSKGLNGFESEFLFRHTCVHYSTEYNNVLIQANILDAMVQPNYFNSIIDRFSEPGEKLILYFDVNGTILCDDSVAHKGVSEILLSDLFRFAEVRPSAPVDFAWGSHPPVRLEAKLGLKDLIHEILIKDHDVYQAFWNIDKCYEFVAALGEQGIPVGLKVQEGQNPPPEELNWTADYFLKKFKIVLEEISRHPSSDGIPRSWFSCHDFMTSAGHSIILNSLGTDTQRIVLNSVCDRRQVLQLTINFKEWTQRDIDSWSSQFTP